MTISVEYACRNAANHPTNLLGHVSWRVQFSDAEGVDGLITVCPVCGREPKEWHYRFPPPPESVSEPQSEPQSGRVSVQIHDERYDFALWTDGQTWPQDGEVDVMEALGPNNDDRRNDVREEREGRTVLLERLREIDEEIARLRDVRRTVQEEYMNYLDHNDV
jgi:hypothetical protein